MPTIEMSPLWATNVLSKILRITDGVSAGITGDIASVGLLNGGSLVGTANLPIACIYLMKGAVPTPNNFTNLTKLSDRSSDILVKFQTGNNSVGDFTGTQENVNPYIINTQYITATATGIASWFWWNVIPSNASGLQNPAVAPLQSLYGTVGITGSGSDLEIDSNQITLGQQYRISGFQLKIPTTWSY